MPNPKKGDAPAAVAQKPAEKPVVKERPVIHPEFSMFAHIGENALTVEQAKELLGWRETAGKDYLLQIGGKKIACDNNVKNRPIYAGSVETYTQDILKRRWKFNGEPIIVGKSGLVLNGQHQLISLIMAEEERLGQQKNQWELYWQGPCTIDKVVEYGIEEDDGTVNTMDTCKPRSFSDVIYRSAYFKSLDAGDRKVAARMMETCIKLLWHRTGADKDAFAPKRTHAEGLDFLARHPRVERCVRHILEENKDGKIKLYINPGLAAGCFYLMATSDSDIDLYSNASPPSEKVLVWGPDGSEENWDKAMDFWTILANGDKELRAVREAIGRLADVNTAMGGTFPEKVAILAHAWSVWKVLPKGEAIQDEHVKLEYRLDENKVRHLIDTSDFGGIDMGNPDAKEELEEDRAPKTPEELEAEKTAAREERKRKLLENRAAKKAAKNGTAPAPAGPIPEPLAGSTDPLVTGPSGSNGAESGGASPGDDPTPASEAPPATNGAPKRAPRRKKEKSGSAKA